MIIIKCLSVVNKKLYEGIDRENKRGSVQEVLKDTEYPAEKRDLVEHARQHNASEDVLDNIKSLPDKMYTSADKVNRKLEGKNKFIGGWK